MRTGWVAPAGREDPEGRYRIGEAVGSVDEQLVAWGDPERTLRPCSGCWPTVPSC